MKGGHFSRLRSKSAVAVTGMSAAVPGKGVLSLKMSAPATIKIAARNYK